MKLGVFDSGIGGEAIAAVLRLVFPTVTITTVNDHKNVPYGSKTPGEIINLTDVAIQPLINANCDVIILACNTATAVAIGTLRTKYPNQKFIGIEPMIKTAAELTRSHTIAVCATPATLASDRYNKLVKKFGGGLSIIEPDCSNWAQMIEDNKINYQLISRTINDMCDRGADVIVLGCTHYNWIEDLITKIADGRAKVIEPSSAISNRVKQLLQLG